MTANPVSLFSNEEKQDDKRVSFLCAKIIYRSSKILFVFLAHRNHEAAHEGVVPLCEDDIWNPQIPWVSAQWTHEAAREGRVRLGYLGIDSCSV